MAASTSPASTLLVWDFDWSLVEENTDTWVIQRLGADAVYQQGRQAGMQWTALMDWCCQEAARQLGRTPAELAAALHATPFDPALIALVQRAGGAGVDMAIVSDANTVYIETILQHHGLAGAVQELHSNPARWEPQGGGALDALRVAPHHAQPHGCRHCPSNLCKGQVLAGLLERRAAAGRSYERILYVGDGKGDFCPSLLLLHGSRHWHPAAALEAAAAAAPAAGGAQARAPAPCGAGGNRVFAREQYPDGLPCSLWVMLRTEARSGGSSSDAGGSGGAEGGSGPAAVVPWSSPEQLAALLTAELGLD